MLHDYIHFRNNLLNTCEGQVIFLIFANYKWIRDSSTAMYLGRCQGLLLPQTPPCSIIYFKVFSHELLILCLASWLFHEGARLSYVSTELQCNSDINYLGLHQTSQVKDSVFHKTSSLSTLAISSVVPRPPALTSWLRILGFAQCPEVQ